MALFHRVALATNGRRRAARMNLAERSAKSDGSVQLCPHFDGALPADNIAVTYARRSTRGGYPIAAPFFL